jgi:hypothetical protein
VLERTASRIRSFALAQKHALQPMEVAVPGGKAGHSLAAVDVAGCYAPGGRYPLPSSVLMTALTARVAGVRMVVVASPRPTPVTLAAAHVAGGGSRLGARTSRPLTRGGNISGLFAEVRRGAGHRRAGVRLRPWRAERRRHRRAREPMGAWPGGCAAGSRTAAQVTAAKQLVGGCAGLGCAREAEV